MRRSFFLMILLTVFAGVFPAAADVIWTPEDDYFYGAYGSGGENGCFGTERDYYIAAGENGYVTAVKSPVDPTPVKSYPNGTVFLIPWECVHDGQSWGAVESFRLPGGTNFSYEEGYISFGDLAAAYDRKAFAELHQDEIKPFEGEFELCDSGELILWEAPGSDIRVGSVTQEFIDELCGSPEAYLGFRTGDFFEDENGSGWLEISTWYFSIRSSGWIRLYQ